MMPCFRDKKTEHLVSLILGRLERESKIGIYRGHRWKAGGVEDQFDEGPLLRFACQLGQKGSCELGEKLANFHHDVYIAEPPVQA